MEQHRSVSFTRNFKNSDEIYGSLDLTGFRPLLPTRQIIYFPANFGTHSWKFANPLSPRTSNSNSAKTQVSWDQFSAEIVLSDRTQPNYTQPVESAEPERTNPKTFFCEEGTRIWLEHGAFDDEPASRPSSVMLPSTMLQVPNLRHGNFVQFVVELQPEFE